MTGYQSARNPAPTGPWRLRAACRDEDPELFFPEAGQTSQAAKQICARCPVITECRTHALTTPERFGTWGGKTQDELQTLKRGRRQPVNRAGCGTPAGYQAQIVVQLPRPRRKHVALLELRQRPSPTHPHLPVCLWQLAPHLQTLKGMTMSSRTRTRPYQVHTQQDLNGKWMFWIVAPNNTTMAKSTRRYTTEDGAVQGAINVLAAWRTNGIKVVKLADR